MRRNRYLLIIGMVLFIALTGFVASAAAKSGTVVGLRIGCYTDAEKAFLGGELLTPMARFIYFNPNVEYVFADNFN